MVNSGCVKSPIFYMGNKFDLLPHLLPYFPDNINTFYDLFGGSGCVSGNVVANKIVYNELNVNVVKLYELFTKFTCDELLAYIHTCIMQFDLDFETVKDVKKSSLKYLEFRDAYNKSDKDCRMLYTLTFYSFCNLMRFNNNEEFNMPYGIRCFKKSNEMWIKSWYECIKGKNIVILNEDAFDILENTEFTKDDFVYLDPPYSGTMAIYNERRAHGGWSVNDDKRLFTLLERLNSAGIKWGMSNVFKNKGVTNQHLIDWCNKNNWNVQHIYFSYSALGKGNSNSDEVYICNYTSDADKNQNLEKHSLWADLLGES